MSERVIWSTDIRPDDQLRVTVSTYRGHELVSLRRYWKPEGAS